MTFPEGLRVLTGGHQSKSRVRNLCIVSRGSIMASLVPGSGLPGKAQGEVPLLEQQDGPGCREGRGRESRQQVGGDPLHCFPDEETKAQRGNLSAQGHTAARVRPGPWLPGSCFPGVRPGPQLLERLSAGARLTLRQREKIKNKTHAGCASPLVVHFASFQLKGESQAWLFITNPDLQRLILVVWGGGLHRPQRNKTEKPTWSPKA